MRLTPRAGSDSVDGERDGILRVRVAAPPVDGRANDALVRLLADRLGLATRAVTLVRGVRGREKVVAVSGLDLATARSRLGVRTGRDG